MNFISCIRMQYKPQYASLREICNDNLYLYNLDDSTIANGLFVVWFYGSVDNISVMSSRSHKEKRGPGRRIHSRHFPQCQQAIAMLVES